jgi:RNA polymerase-binding transcription factor DksA
MDIATQYHLTTLRNALVYRLDQLRADVHAIEIAERARAVERLDREGADVIPPAGRGGAEEGPEIDEMRRVEAALHRLDAGVYGDCTQCGEPIGATRLLVQPAAERCAACQAAFERAARAGSNA